MCWVTFHNDAAPGYLPQEFELFVLASPDMAVAVAAYILVGVTGQFVS